MWIQIGAWKVRTVLPQNGELTDDNGLILNYDKIILLLLYKVSKGISNMISFHFI